MAYREFGGKQGWRTAILNFFVIVARCCYAPGKSKQETVRIREGKCGKPCQGWSVRSRMTGRSKSGRRGLASSKKVVSKDFWGGVDEVCGTFFKVKLR